MPSEDLGLELYEGLAIEDSLDSRAELLRVGRTGFPVLISLVSKSTAFCGGRLSALFMLLTSVGFGIGTTTTAGLVGSAEMAGKAGLLLEVIGETTAAVLELEGFDDAAGGAGGTEVEDAFEVASVLGLVAEADDTGEAGLLLERISTTTTAVLELDGFDDAAGGAGGTDAEADFEVAGVLGLLLDEIGTTTTAVLELDG